VDFHVAAVRRDVEFMKKRTGRRESIAFTHGTGKPIVPGCTGEPRAFAFRGVETIEKGAAPTGAIPAHRHPRGLAIIGKPKSNASEFRMALGALSESDVKILRLLLRVPRSEWARVLDVIRAIRVTPAYVREREDCLRKMGLR
jgi:hypothetical protein